MLDDLARARVEPDGVLEAGAVMRSFAKPNTEAADMAYRVVAAKRPHHLEIESEVGNFRSRARYQIDGNRDGSRVTLTAEIEGARWIDRVIVSLARKRYLGQFKASLEPRLRAMLTLAERIAQEGNAARE